MLHTFATFTGCKGTNKSQLVNCKNKPILKPFLATFISM